MITLLNSTTHSDQNGLPSCTYQLSFDYEIQKTKVDIISDQTCNCKHKLFKWLNYVWNLKQKAYLT